MKAALEDFFYRKIIKRLMLTSKLGRQCVLGEASTGYNFDHMYENKPEGSSGIGRLVDSILLSLPSVKATRHRKEKIIEILKKEIDNLQRKGIRPRIIDIACGAGRYLVEMEPLAERTDLDVLGVDIDIRSIKLGEFLAQSHRIPKSILRFVRGNVFRLDHLRRFADRIQWTPRVVVASGLIVYLDDTKTKAVLSEVCRVLDEGGLFLFSSQQANPSRKLMEKVCNTDKGAWILYYRQPNGLVSWLKEAGFGQVDYTVDRWGMYNLFCARK